MEFYNSKDEKIDLFDITSIKKVNIVLHNDYELIYNHSFALGSIVVLCFGIKKKSGVFTSDDFYVGDLDIEVKLGTSFCGLGEGTDWSLYRIGYLFCNSYAVLVSDRLNTNTCDRAFINTVCMKK